MIPRDAPNKSAKEGTLLTSPNLVMCHRHVAWVHQILKEGIVRVWQVPEVPRLRVVQRGKRELLLRPCDHL